MGGITHHHHPISELMYGYFISRRPNRMFQYLGQWYEQKRFPAFFQLNTRCVRAEYGATEG
jgi:lipocalin